MSRILILSACILLLHQPGYSQNYISASEFNPTDSLNTGKLLSTYREFYKWEQYDLAQESWWTIFNDFPDISEKLYVDGVTMFRQFIEEAPEGPARDAKVDTLMLIYDQRIQYFGGEGNVLGRKGSDLLRYRGDNMEQVQSAYSMLKRSLELEGTSSRDVVLLNFMASGIMLYQADVFDKGVVMEDYFTVSNLLDQLEGGSSRWEKTRASVDEMILKEAILTCEGLDSHFGPRFAQNSGDRDLLEKMIRAYTASDCSKSELYSGAAEKIYELDPSAQSAHNLAVLFIGREDLEKAAYYLNMAVAGGEDLPKETLADWFYELSVISLVRGESCGAVGFAREAILNNAEHGKAYMALGDAFIASRKQLGDEFQQKTAFWAAADMYRAAAGVDSSLADESEEKVAYCSGQFPSKEDIFFQDIELGRSFRVGGCIQENTTVRSSD